MSSGFEFCVINCLGAYTNLRFQRKHQGRRVCTRHQTTVRRSCCTRRELCCCSCPLNRLAGRIFWMWSSGSRCRYLLQKQNNHTIKNDINAEKTY
jgi:hypothetical protein